MANSQDYGLLTSTVASAEDAGMIARFLIREKLAACVQTMPIQSHYIWKGEEVHDNEVLLLIKTRTVLFETVMAAIAKLHPYETPEIVAQPFTAGHAPYFAWIDEATKA